MKTRTLSLLLCALMFSSSTTLSAATPVKQNSKCTKINQKITYLQFKFQCLKSGNKLIWKKIQIQESTPLVLYVPRFIPVYSNNVPGENPHRFTVAIYDVSQAVLENQKISAFELQTKRQDASEWLPSKVLSVKEFWTLPTGQKVWSAYWSMLPSSVGTEIVSRVRAISGKTFGSWSEEKITGTTEPTSNSPLTPTPTPTPTATPTATPTPTPTPTPTSGTAAQSSATTRAKSYLQSSSFSRTRLIRQLEFEGFSNSDATNGVDSLNVNWSNQAILRAKSYLQSTSFSRQSLIKQLLFEGFSDADSIAGVDAQNADWNAQAALRARSYLGSSTFTKESLTKQLLFEGFTLEQAAYGVNAVGL